MSAGAAGGESGLSGDDDRGVPGIGGTTTPAAATAAAAAAAVGVACGTFGA